VNSGTEQLTSLRNERKPCHFWVDNEVADCYQPIVGADAIWVYCRIARNAHGAWIVSLKRRDGDTRVSLREMAEWCGKSVDTVWRCMQVLEHVGLLQVVHGAKSSGRYALADVKDLVTREGAEYDRVMGSFQLPSARVAELKQQVKELRAKLARKDGARLAVIAGKESVAQSDRLEGQLFSAPDAKCDSFVAQSDTSVAPDVHVSITTRKQESKTNYTPQPPQAGECDFDVPDDLPFTEEQLAHLAKHANDASWTSQWEGYYREANQADAREAAKAAEEQHAEMERLARLKAELATVSAAADWVMRQCGFVKSRRRRGVEPVIEGVLAQELAAGKPLWEIAPKMAKAWESYQRNGEFLRVQYGPVKFFELGIWRDSRGWTWNEEKLERQRGASVGSAR
jgi:cell division septum initiation protein DivIVA